MSVYPHRHDSKAQIYTKGDNLFVSHAELLENGYEALEDFDIVYLNGTFYELQGYVEKPDAWWIEAVDIPEAEANADTQPEE